LHLQEQGFEIGYYGTRKNGWFVPVATLLDHLLAVRGRHEISNAERRRLERKWLLEKLLVGTN
jgi:hypothetical protein